MFHDSYSDMNETVYIQMDGWIPADIFTNWHRKRPESLRGITPKDPRHPWKLLAKVSESTVYDMIQPHNIQ